MSITFSLIIPTLNRADLLPVCLKSIIELDFDKSVFEVLVIDNGSTDKTKSTVQDAFLDSQINYTYFYEDEPGLLSGRHLGAEKAKGDIFVFLDDDVILSKDYLNALSNTFRDHEIKLVGGKSTPYYLSDPPLWLQTLWTIKDDVKTCSYLSLIDLGDTEKEINPFDVWGLNFSIRKDVFYELGGFHPDNISKEYQKYQGDGESGLARKLIDKKYKAWYNPQVSVRHIIPASRLTLNYFYNRQYYQGVCDSYTEIRNSISKPTASIEIGFITKIKMHVKEFFFHSITKQKLARIEENINKPDILKELNYVMKKGYEDGYSFHKNEVRKDPSLINWIKKENYFDYKLPLK